MKNKTTTIAITAIVAVLIVTGIYILIKAPALKPNPVPDYKVELDSGSAPKPQAKPKPESDPEPKQEPKPEPEPIPGVEPLDQAKYNLEPQIKVYLADTGAIETMLLEKYLEGVIAQEVDPSWPLEALAAQAVASRTLTISAIEAGTIRRLHNADVSTSKEELQAYAPQKVNDNVREAVRKTRGEVLLYAGGIVNAIYSSCNGQISATKEESFPVEISHPTPYFQPVADNCYKYAPESVRSWTLKIPASEVTATIGHEGNPGDIGILEKGPSGRALYIGADGGKKVHAADFRKWTGYDRLKSTLITQMSYDGKDFIFKGEGWGNGVGLCQWGAYTYAVEQKNYTDILQHYYPGSNIKKLWE